MNSNTVQKGTKLATWPNMENKKDQPANHLLQHCTQLLNKAEAADILQNDVSQTLAAVLLWVQSAMENEALANNQQLQLAETHLKESIKKLVRLHYDLLE